MSDPPPRNRDLLLALVSDLRKDAPVLRIGAMFGCPAAFAGRPMAFCVCGDAVGVKLARDDAGVADRHASRK
jgi:hypothetical protein